MPEIAHVSGQRGSAVQRSERKVAAKGGEERKKATERDGLSKGGGVLQELGGGSSVDNWAESESGRRLEAGVKEESRGRSPSLCAGIRDEVTAQENGG